MAYYPAIPEIAKAFENDPKTRLALSMLQAGGSGAPTAGGKYGIWDGIARALQGVAGGYFEGKQAKHYKGQEQDLMSLYANALGGGAPAQQAPVPPPQAPVAQMPPQAAPQAPPQPQQPPPPLDPLAPLPDAPAAPRGLPPQAAPQLPPQAPPAAPDIAAALGAPKPRYQGASMVPAMLPITAQSESANRDYTKGGAPVTSSAGAKFKMQVMPGTAHDPGLGVTPARNDTPEEYNRVGTEYLGKLMERYHGDPSKAWAAYNAGFARVDHAVAKHGDDWLAHLKPETQAYVAKNVAALGTDGGSTDPAQGQYYPQDEHTPTGPVNYQTAEPELPGMPERPAARPAVQSQRLAAGRELMRSQNPYAFTNAMRMVEEGMGDQFAADREALGAERDLDRTQYDAALGNRYQAEGAKRNAAYDARSSERGEQYAFGREQRGFAHDTNERVATQGFQSSEAGKTRTFQHDEGVLDRTAQHELTQMQIDGRIQTAREKTAARFQNFLSTPQGSKMYETVSSTIKFNDDIVSNLQQFTDLNAKTDTGGLILNDPTGAGSWTARTLSPDLQQMDSITNKIAPVMRTAGAGSMSDKDLAGFKQSVPNIYASRKANAANAVRLTKGFQRMTDFEMARMQAAADGNQAQFMKEWNIFRNKVSIMSGTTFEEWKATLPQYGADGKPK